MSSFPSYIFEFVVGEVDMVNSTEGKNDPWNALKCWKRQIAARQYNICSFTNERNMHVYFLLSYHSWLDTEMETCYLHLWGSEMLWLSGSDTHIQVSKAWACVKFIAL